MTLLCHAPCYIRWVSRTPKEHPCTAKPGKCRWQGINNACERQGPHQMSSKSASVNLHQPYTLQHGDRSSLVEAGYTLFSYSRRLVMNIKLKTCRMMTDQGNYDGFRSRSRAHMPISDCRASPGAMMSFLRSINSSTTNSLPTYRHSKGASPCLHARRDSLPRLCPISVLDVKLELPLGPVYPEARPLLVLSRAPFPAMPNTLVSQTRDCFVWQVPMLRISYTT